MITPGVKKEDAPAMFPKGFKTIGVPSGKGYIRMTPQPE